MTEGAVGHLSDTASIWSYREGDVVVLVLDRPAVHNAVATPDLKQLQHLLGHAGDAGAMVLASEGPDFCVGADLCEIASAWGNRSLIRAFLSRFQDVADAIAAGPIPVVAAVQGLALAGGLELALACDVIVAADDAEFGDQHINVGLIPGGGGSQRLPRAIGARRSLALQLFGTRLDAETALEWGLVHSVCAREHLRTEAIKAAAHIASRNRLAVRHIRELGRAAAALSLPEGLAIELEMATNHLSESPLPDALLRFAEPRSVRSNRKALGRPEEVA